MDNTYYELEIRTRQKQYIVTLENPGMSNNTTENYGAKESDHLNPVRPRNRLDYVKLHLTSFILGLSLILMLDQPACNYKGKQCYLL